MTFQTAFVALEILYLVATLFYLLRVLTLKRVLAAVGLRITMVTAVLQAAVLMAHFITQPGQAFSSYLDYFQLTALALALVFVALCLLRDFHAAGPVFLPLIVAFNILSLTHDNPYSFITTRPGYGWLSYHLASIFLSLAAFSLGLVSAVTFLLLERQIKLKRIVGWTAKLPPLAVIDGIHYKSLYAGFIFFSLTIITGAGFAKATTGHYLSGDFKQVLSILIWVFFALLLNLRVSQGLQGHKGVLASLFGFAGMVLLFFVGLG